MDEYSSSEDEIDIGVQAPSAGWRDGKPVDVTLQQKISDAEARLEKCVAGLDHLQQKTQKNSSFVNHELKQELEWASQEVAVAKKNSKSRFATKYIESCETHLQAASNLWQNIKYIQSHSRKLELNLLAVKRMAASTGPQFSKKLEKDLAQASAEVTKVLQRLKHPSVAATDVNEILCAAAARVSRLHDRLAEFSDAANQAIEEKCAGVGELGTHEAFYDDACGQLEDFVDWFDRTAAQDDTWTVPRQQEKLGKALKAFVRAEAATRTARDTAEAAVETWMEDTAELVGGEHKYSELSERQLAEAKERTEAAIASLKREQLRVPDQQGAPEATPRSPPKSPRGSAKPPSSSQSPDRNNAEAEEPVSPLDFPRSPGDPGSEDMERWPLSPQQDPDSRASPTSPMGSRLKERVLEATSPAFPVPRSQLKDTFKPSASSADATAVVNRLPGTEWNTLTLTPSKKPPPPRRSVDDRAASEATAAAPEAMEDPGHDYDDDDDEEAGASKDPHSVGLLKQGWSPGSADDKKLGQVGKLNITWGTKGGDKQEDEKPKPRAVGRLPKTAWQPSNAPPAEAMTSASAPPPNARHQPGRSAAARSVPLLATRVVESPAVESSPHVEPTVEAAVHLSGESPMRENTERNNDGEDEEPTGGPGVGRLNIQRGKEDAPYPQHAGVGRLNVQRGEKHPNPAKPQASAGRLPPNAWKETAPTQSHQPTRQFQPSSVRASAPLPRAELESPAGDVYRGDAKYDDQGQNEDAPDLLDDAPEDASEPEETRVGRLNVQWGEKQPDSVKPQGSVGRLPPNAWKETAPTQSQPTRHPQPISVRASAPLPRDKLASSAGDVNRGDAEYNNRGQNEKAPDLLDGTSEDASEPEEIRVGKLNVQWGEKHPDSVKPQGSVGRLPPNAWKETAPTQSHQPTRHSQPSSVRASAPLPRDEVESSAGDVYRGDTEYDGQGQNEDVPDLWENVNSDVPEPEENQVGRLNVQWGEKHPDPAKPQASTGRLPPNAWNESAPTQSHQPPRHSQPNSVRTSAPLPGDVQRAENFEPLDDSSENPASSSHPASSPSPLRAGNLGSSSSPYASRPAVHAAGPDSSSPQPASMVDTLLAHYADTPAGVNDHGHEANVALEEEKDDSGRGAGNENQPPTVGRLPPLGLDPVPRSPTLSQVLSERPVGKVPSDWRLEKEHRKKNASAVEDAIMGKLKGDEWAPHAVSPAGSRGGEGEVGSRANQLTSQPELRPTEGVKALLGLVSRSKSTLESRVPVRSPSPSSQPSAVATSRTPFAPSSPVLATRPPPAAPKTEIKNMASVVGLVTRLVGVFDEQKMQNTTEATAPPSIQRREVPMRGGGARRAKIDAALALAASRTRQRQRANAGEGQIAKDHGLQRHELKLLENILKTYDGSEGNQADMREFAAAMSNPKIAHFIRRVVSEGNSREAEPEEVSGGALDRTLSVEALFDEGTIKDAAAVSLQAQVRRRQTQRKLAGHTG